MNHFGLFCFNGWQLYYYRAATICSQGENYIFWIRSCLFHDNVCSAVSAYILEKLHVEKSWNVHNMTGIPFVLTDLGPGQWKTETVPDWAHQHRAWRGDQQSQPLPVLLWRRQASQVLGSGVQQGKTCCDRAYLHVEVLSTYWICGFSWQWWYCIRSSGTTTDTSVLCTI